VDSPETKDAISQIKTQNQTDVQFKETSVSYNFTKIFDNVSNIELYEETLKDLTLDILEQQSDGVYMGIGPSNSGKSFTIYGDNSNPGISIYAINEIFDKVGSNLADYRVFKKHFGESFVVSSKADKNCSGEFGVSISVCEIYNDRIRDLTLDQSKTHNQSLDIITDIKDGKIKPNKARQIYVSNIDEAKVVLHKSIKRRAVSPTNINHLSSRSHLFIYFNVHRRVGSAIKSSRLTIADLAGSERSKFAKTEGKEFKEGNYTNTSLTELGRCLALMKSKKFDRSLLRTSKLTRLLLTDLFGNFNQNKIKILLTIDPFSSSSTISHALRYIQPVTKVTINSERNSVEPVSEQVFQLNEELKLNKEQNQALTKQLEENLQKLTEQEFQVRQELSEEYEHKINELDLKHTEELNNLKEQHQESLDMKLDLLSKDYGSMIEQLTNKHDDEMKVLKDKLQDITTKYEAILVRDSNDTQLDVKNKALEDQLKELKEQLEKESNEKDGAKQEAELRAKQFKDLSQKYTTLTTSHEELIKKNEELSKDLKHQKKKNKKISKEMEESTSTKRRSEQIEDDDSGSDCDNDEKESHKKLRKSEESKKNHESKSIFEDDDLMKFSPIKLTKSPSKDKSNSPSKKSKSPNKSPSKKKKSIESPKRQPLHDSILENSFTSPVKSKSPSKSGKKKIQPIKIVDESFSD